MNPPEMKKMPERNSGYVWLVVFLAAVILSLYLFTRHFE
ncbi:MAG: hypothetical protein RL213_1059 [Bacteroidota bacterium]|jgi:hypothetical protein